MKPHPKVPQPPAEVPRRAEHDTSGDQKRRAGERSGEGADALRPYLSDDRIGRVGRERRGIPG